MKRKDKLLEDLRLLMRNSTLPNLYARLKATRLGPVCSRCGGSGSFSYNRQDGTMCYGCGGSGHMAPKTIAQAEETLKRARIFVEAGKLDEYGRCLYMAKRLEGRHNRLFKAWHDTDTVVGYSKNGLGNFDNPLGQRRMKLNGRCNTAVDAFSKLRWKLQGKMGHEIVDAAEQYQELDRLYREALQICADVKEEAMQDSLILAANAT